MLTDPNDATLARIIVTLGNELALTVIAEGVETIEQQRFLAENGCHHYQGYLYGRPLPVAEFEAALGAGVAAVPAACARYASVCADAPERDPA